MTDTSRRNFLLGAAGLTGVAATGAWPSVAGAAADNRGYVSAHFVLTLDGKETAGLLSSAEGGEAVGEVVVEPVGPDRIVRKHIAGVKYEDITITCGTGMSKGVYEWIKSAFDGSAQRRSGSVVLADHDYQERSRVEFTEALITEVGMPALDASSKDAAKMTIKMSPEYTRTKQGSGEKIEAPRNTEQKKWLPANFRLTIDGLDEACARVNKIEALTVKQKVVENAVGEVREYEKEPATVEVPNLVITFPESHAKAFYDWHEDFVVKGNNGQDKEKGGTLEYLSADLRTVLFTLTFKNLGIFKMTPEKSEAGSDQIRRVKAEMYCEELDFKVPPAAFG